MAKRVGANRRKKKSERRALQGRTTAGRMRTLGRAARSAVIAVLICAAAFLVARGASAWIDSSKVFTLEKIRVCGVSLMDTSDVLARAEMTMGTHLARLDVRAVAARLENNPVVRRVRVRRRLPNAVDIIVQEREPVALINSGTVCLVDRNGVLFPLVPKRYADVPVVSGLTDTMCDDSTRRLTPQSLGRLRGLLDGMQKARPELARRVSQLTFRSDGSARIRLDGSPTVVDMETDCVEKRTEQLWHIVTRCRQAGVELPRRIDLRYANLAFVR